MQLTADKSSDLDDIWLIDRLQSDGVDIAGVTYRDSLILTGNRCWPWTWGHQLMQQYEPQPSLRFFEQLSKMTWQHLSLTQLGLDLGKLEVLLLGMPHKTSTPLPQLMAECAGYGIGLEIMPIDSACRTYNILAADYRSVVLMLLQSPMIKKP